VQVTTEDGDGAEPTCGVCGRPGRVEFYDADGTAACGPCARLFNRLCRELRQLAPPSVKPVSFKTKLSDFPDSLALVGLVMDLEEEFVGAVSDQEASRFDSIADVIRAMRQQSPDNRWDNDSL
jgi:acyl carrier protein